MHQPRTELLISQSHVQCLNHYTTEPAGLKVRIPCHDSCLLGLELKSRKSESLGLIVMKSHEISLSCETVYLKAFLTLNCCYSIFRVGVDVVASGENVEEAFLETAKKIYQNIQDGRYIDASVSFLRMYSVAAVFFVLNFIVPRQIMLSTACVIGSLNLVE